MQAENFTVSINIDPADVTNQVTVYNTVTSALAQQLTSQQQQLLNYVAFEPVVQGEQELAVIAVFSAS